MYDVLVLLFCLTVGTAVNAVPTSHTSSATMCTKTCLPSQMHKFQFEKGHVYHYDYKVKSSVNSTETRKTDQEVMDFEAAVDLQFDSPCELSLRIRDPKVDGRALPSLFADVTDNTVRAIYSDGVLEEVCAAKKECVEALNLKKGILSSIQNLLPSNSTIFQNTEIEEKDVLGICPTVYSVEEYQSGKIRFTKSKDHSMCTERPTQPMMSPLATLMVKYTEKEKVSKSSCIQETERAILKYVKCSDTHEILSLSSGNNIEIYKQESTLVFRHSSKTSVLSQNIMEEEIVDMMFTTNRKPALNPNKVHHLEVIMNKLNSLYDDVDGSPDAHLFSQLVQTMNEVPENTIADILNKIRVGTYGKNKEELEALYLDAVFSTTNSGAIEVLVDDILHGKNVVRNSINLFFFTGVTKFGLSSIRRLYQDEKVPETVLLAAGTVIGSFCTANTESCTETTEVSEIMNMVATELQDICDEGFTSDGDINRATILLKSVGNMKRVNAALESALLHCLDQQTTPTSIKIAVTEVLKYVPCQSQITSHLLNHLFDGSQSTEMRIFSYRAAIKCANADEIHHMLSVLQGDSNSQVISYVTSHLQNKQESTSEENKELRKKISTMNIPNSPNTLNISQNTQWLNIGEIIDLTSDFIVDYEDKLSLNLRTKGSSDLLKENSDMFEIGTRVDLISALKVLASEKGILDETMMGKTMQSILASYPQINGDEYHDFFIKLLGHEIFSTSQGFVDYSVLESILEGIANTLLGDVLGSRALKSQLDYVIPTVQGIPLHLRKSITLVIDLTPTLSDFTIQISPKISTVVETFSGYEFGPSFGISSKTELDSHDQLKVILEMNYESFSMNLEIPVKEQAELLTVNYATFIEKRIDDLHKVMQPTYSESYQKLFGLCLPEVDGNEICFEDSTQDSDANSKAMRGRVVLKRQDSTVKEYAVKMMNKMTGTEVGVQIVKKGTHFEKRLIDLSYVSRSDSTLLTIIADTLNYQNGVKVQITTENEDDNKLEVWTDLKKMNDEGHKVFDLKMSYTPSPHDEMIISARTLGELEKYIHLNLDARLKDGLDSLLSFEFDVSCEYLTLSNSFTVTTDSEDSSTYLSQMTAEYKTGNHPVTIHLQSETRNEKEDLTTTTSAKLKTKSRDFEFKFNQRLSEREVYRELQFSEGRQGVLFHTLSRNIHSERDVESVLLLEVPFANRRIKWKLETKLPKLSGQIDTEILFSLKNGDDLLFSIRGPLELDSASSIFKTNLGISLPPLNQNFHIYHQFEFSAKRNYITVELTNEESVLISYLHDILTSDELMTIVSKIQQQHNWRSDVEVAIMKSGLKTSFGLQVPSVLHKRVDGDFNLQSTGDQGYYSGKLQWYDENIHRRISTISGNYHFEEKKDSFIIITRGVYTTDEDEYPFIISSETTEGPTPWMNIHRSTLFEIRHDEQEYFSFENTLKQMLSFRDKEYSSSTETIVRMPDKQKYTMKHQIEVETGGKYSYNLESDVQFSDKWILALKERFYIDEHSNLEVEVFADFHDGSHSEVAHIIDSRINIRSLSYLEEAKASLSYKTLQKNYYLEANSKTSLGMSEILFKEDGDVHCHLTSMLEDTKLTIDLKRENHDSKVVLNYEDGHKSIVVYPDYKHLDDKRYGISYHEDQLADGIRSNVTMEIHYNDRPMIIESSITKHPSETLYQITVADELGFLLVIKELGSTPSSFQYIAYLVSKDKNIGPILTIEVSSSDVDQSFTAIYKKEESSTSPIIITLSSKELSDHSVIFSFKIESKSVSVNLGGTLTYIDSPDCSGSILDSTIRLQDAQHPYHLQAEFCTPAFVGIVGRKGSSQTSYGLDLGFKNQNSAEVSLIRKDDAPVDEYQWRFLFQLEAILKNSQALELSGGLMQEELIEFMNVTATELQILSTDIESILSEIISEIATDLKSKNTLLRYVVEYLENIWPSLDVIRVLNDIKTEAANLSQLSDLKNVIEKLVREKNHLLTSIKDFITDLRTGTTSHEELSNLMAILRNASRTVFMRHCPLSESYCATILRSFEERILMDVLKMNLQLDFDRIDANELTGLFSRNLERFSFIDWFPCGLDILLLTKSQNLHIGKSDHSMSLTVPLREPVSSVFEAPFMIGVSEEEKSHMMQIDHNITRVHKSFKMVNTNLLTTLYNKQVHLPSTKCEYYLLKQNKGAAMTMSSLNQTDFKLMVRFGGHNVSISVTDSKIFIDGKEQVELRFMETLVPLKFHVRRSKDDISVSAPGLQWDGKLSEQFNRVRRQGWGVGVAYEKNLSDKLSDSDKMLILQRQKVDLACKD